MTVKLCIHCKSLRETGSSFCSDECGRAWDRKRKSKAWKERGLKDLTCKSCGEVFQHKDKRKQYCSIECERNINNGPRMTKQTTETIMRNRMSPEDFVELYEKVKSSRQLARMLDVSRSGLDNYYRKLKFIPESVKKTCKKCNVEFSYTLKSPRDSVSLCPACKKGVMQDINKDYIQGRPSHRRMSSRDPKILEEITPYLEGTSFVEVAQCPESDTHVNLTCICGNLVTLRVKDFRQKSGSRKKSCGCMRGTGVSIPEKELVKLVEDFTHEEILENRKPKFMQGLELDIYIPERNLAIEFHGLVYHSERPLYGDKCPIKIKTQHETKYLRCKEAGVRLIQIFEDEWREKRRILESMVSNAVGQSSKLNARDGTISLYSGGIFREFQNETHINGYTNAAVGFGLYINGELVSAITLRNTWNKSYGDKTIEIARFSTKLNTQVRGGFSKLLKAAEKWIREQGYNKILTYADCRFGSGGVYRNNGFQHVGKTPPNYFYEKGGIRENRFKHRKSRDLSGSTEREQQNNLGWYAIYDAGNEIYIKEIGDLKES
ncbi:MAG: hypothetical protein DRN81_02405 [Thermoproteota archaeon]|nr:MAG: hypothetical protein DRN81_02405 [Candidatus Korarchaeota archaeon]